MVTASLERDHQGNARFCGCSNIRDFEFLGKLGEGTFGYVCLVALSGPVCGAYTRPVKSTRRDQRETVLLSH